MTNHVISGLTRRRRELAGDILELLGKVDALAYDLDTVDRALKLFDPDIELDNIPALQNRPKADWALRGEIVRIVFTILREASEPMSTRDLAASVMACRGIEGSPGKVEIKRMRKCLDRQRERGTLIAESIGGSLHWRVRSGCPAG